MAWLCFKHVFLIIIKSMAITRLAAFSPAIKMVVLNASNSWTVRASIKILYGRLIWELGLTSMFPAVVGKLSPKADFHLVKVIDSILPYSKQNQSKPLSLSTTYVADARQAGRLVLTICKTGPFGTSKACQTVLKIPRHFTICSKIQK